VSVVVHSPPDGQVLPSGQIAIHKRSDQPALGVEDFQFDGPGTFQGKPDLGLGVEWVGMILFQPGHVRKLGTVGGAAGDLKANRNHNRSRHHLLNNQVNGVITWFQTC